MRLVILALGSRGDVQPLVALGLGLQASGHAVSIATDRIFEGFVRQAGLQFAPVTLDARALFESEVGQAALDGSNLLRSMRNFVRLFTAVMPQVGIDSMAACQTAEAILYSASGFYAGPSLAEKLGVMSIAAFNFPLHPTGAFPSIIFSATQKRGRLVNYGTHHLGLAILWLPYLRTLNRLRREQLRLPPLGVDYAWRALHLPSVFGFSSKVVPRPADWPRQVEGPGFWFLDRASDWRPPAELARFIAAGPAPIYVGFGSMSDRHAHEATQMVVQALARTKQRGILAMGWGGLDAAAVSDTVFVVESVPHDWLFPQMAAVIHHGGPGTTAAGLRAGVPSIIVPHFLDQPFWGWCVADLGVGPQPIPRQKLSVDRLAAAIRVALTDQDMRRRASDLGEAIRAENGVARAVERINHYLSRCAHKERHLQARSRDHQR